MDTRFMHYPVKLETYSFLPLVHINEIPSTSSFFNGLANNTIPFDLPSYQGKFGWTQVCGDWVPFILRNNNEHYISIKIINEVILKKNFPQLRNEVFKCANPSTFIFSPKEYDLYNHINLNHCACKYGNDKFFNHDMVIKEKDLQDFITFLYFCLNKLILKYPYHEPNMPCGFMRVGKHSSVPFTLVKGVKYVPLIYFDGVTEEISRQSIYLDCHGLELAYLRFCCKLQGLRAEHLETPTIKVIKLSLIQSCYPDGTKFEEYWPHRGETANLLVD